MQFPRLPVYLAAAALLAFAPLTRATTVIQPTFDRLVDSADYIVRGVVVAVDSEWRDDPTRPGKRYIASQVTVEVLETIKGDPPEPLVLQVVGGRIGDTELVVDGAPKFVEGEESVLFVRNNGRNFFPLVGMMHGYFPVQRDATTGRAQVLRFNGRPVTGDQDLNPSENPVAALRVGVGQGITPQAFRERIRQKQAEINTREKLR